MFYVKNYSPVRRFCIEDFMKDAEKFLNDPFTKEPAPKYPLTNIGYSDEVLVFELALAGFKKENIKVSYVGNVVSVKATYKTDDKCSDDCKCPEVKYVQQNISHKDVARSFYLSNEYLGAKIKWKFVDGLLTIAVYQNNEDNQIEASDDDENLYGCVCKPSEDSEEI